MKRDLLWKSFPRKIINEMLWCSTLTVLLESEKHVNVSIFQKPNLQKYFLVIPLKNKVSHNRSIVSVRTSYDNMILRKTPEKAYLMIQMMQFSWH